MSDLGGTVDRPIFIVGTGRNGSTALHRLLSRHPEVAWIPSITSRFPRSKPLLRTAANLAGLPIVGSVLRRGTLPSEAYPYWRHHCPAFFDPCRDLRAEDVTPTDREGMRRAVYRIVSARRRRFIGKVTGWGRIGFLNEIFPDARFIHLVRDGRAVASSLLNVSWWRGWGGPENWNWGPLSVENQKEWEEHHRSFVALAGIQWKMLVASIREAAAAIDSDRFFETRYEQLCTDAVAETRRIIEFCGLSWSRRFERTVGQFGYASMNDKWKSDLTPDQGATLEEVLAGELRLLGYL